MRHLYALVGFLWAASLLNGCSVGPRRLGKDCSWSRRSDTLTEERIEAASIVGIVGGLAVFLPAFIASRPDIGVPALSSIFVSIPLGWWAMGAFEEIPAPWSRQKRCRETVWAERSRR